MNESYIKKIYNKKMFGRFIFIGAAGVIAAALLFVGIISWYNNSNHPAEVSTAADYNSAEASRKYIKVSAPKMYDLGLVNVRTTKWLGIINTGKSTTGEFVVVNLDEKLLAIELPVSKYDELKSQLIGDYVFTGRIVGFNYNDSETYRQALVRAGIPEDKLDQYSYTSYLQYLTPGESASAYFVLAIFIAFLACVFLIPSLLKNRNAVKSLRGYSNGDVESVYRNIDSEINMPDVYKNGPITITQNYIIGDAGQFVFSLPLKELMWAYKRSIKKKSYGVTIKTTYGITFVFSDKTSYNIRFNKNEQRVNQILKYIYEHVSTCICGYSEQRRRLFKTNPNEFINLWKNSKNVSV